MIKQQYKIGLILMITLFEVIVFLGCKKNDVSVPLKQTDSIFDIDGNVYKTVKIGDQWWMAENLHVTRYRNGLSILKISDNNAALWDSNIVKGAYCLFEYGGAGSTMGDSTGKNIPMGFLYNWFAVNDTSNIAPKGWHVATEQDWQTLESYLGIPQNETTAMGWRGRNEANKLRYKSYGWNPSDNLYIVYGTNESGFSAFGAGCRMFKTSINNGLSLWGDYKSPGHDAYWWTATQNPDSTKCAWYRNLNYNSPKIFRYYAQKSYGFSVRCVKD